MSEEKPKISKKIFSPFEEDEFQVYEFAQEIEKVKVMLKIKELTSGEDSIITKKAFIVRGKGRKREHDLDTGLMKNERIYYSCKHPRTGLFLDGVRIDLTPENIPRLKQKIADWIYEKILEVNELLEEEEKN